MKWKKIKNNLLSAFSLNINRAAFFVALFFFSTIINANTFQQKNNRYLWVVRTALIAEKNIDEMIQFATLNRINNIIVQVRGRGDAYYNSKIVSKSNLIKNKEFDPLLYTLNSAKDKGIKVHVWLNTYLLWSSKKLPFQKDHILLTNPEWLDHNKFSLPNIASELKKVGSKNNSYEGLYLSPDHPSVNKHLLNVFKELLLNYEIDGLHLDYIRFHDSDYGKNSYVYSDIDNNIIKYSDSGSKWTQIKRNSITDLVRKTKNLITELGFDIEFSAAVKPNLNEAKQRYYQEWDVWLAAGYLDKAMIMNYSPDLKVFSNNINILFRNLPLKYRNKIVMGLATYNQTSDQVVNKIKYSKIASINDFAFFSYNVMSHNPRYFRSIKNELYK